MTGLLLNAASLCSKWGFGDGDAPDEVWDQIESAGGDALALEWHPILTRLVRERLLPEVERDRAVEVYEIETIHNPIRAKTVDGVAVDDYSDDDHGLADYSVTVPWGEVMALVQRAAMVAR